MSFQTSKLKYDKLLQHFLPKCIDVSIFLLQDLSIRFWMHIPIMFKVWHGIRWANMLLHLVLIELAGFMYINLSLKAKALIR